MKFLLLSLLLLQAPPKAEPTFKMVPAAMADSLINAQRTSAQKRAEYQAAISNERAELLSILAELGVKPSQWDAKECQPIYNEQTGKMERIVCEKK